MTPRELDQFLVDPISETLYPDGKVLFDAVWIQSQLRELEELRRVNENLGATMKVLTNVNTNLRNHIKCLESKFPYTYINVKA